MTTDNLMLVYENLAELYEIKEDYEKSMYYAALAYDYQDKVNNFYIPYLFLLKAKLNFKLNKIDKAVELINQGLMIAEKVSGVDKLIDLHFLQMEIDLQTKQYFNNLHQLEKLCRNNWRLSKF